MANEGAPNTRTISVPWLALVTRADPDWARDSKMQVQDERRPNVLINIATTGPYAP